MSASESFTIGDLVRSKPRRGGWIDYQGRVLDIDRINGKARLHNAEQWVALSDLEPVPQVDPTSLNKNGNTSFLG
jgi:hypothetical protein